MMTSDLLEIPSGWSLIKLSDICEKVGTIDPRESPEKKFTYIEISSIDKTKQKITQVEHFLGKDAPSRARQLIKTGDILFSTVRLYLKKISIVDEAYDNQIASTGFCIIRPCEGIDKKLIFYFVQTNKFLDSLKSHERGTHYPAVRCSDVLEQSVPIPPLQEQKRIIANLEALFIDKDIALEALDQISLLSKQLRQSTLAHVFIRKSARHQYVNDSIQKTLEAAKQRAKNNSVEKNRGQILPELREGWTWIRFGDLIDSMKNGIYKQPQYYGPGTPCLRMYNIEDGKIVLKNVREMVLSDSEIEEYGLHENDILLNRVNSREYVGKAAVISKNLGNIVFESKNVRIRLNQALADPKYINYYLLTRYARDQIESTCKQTVGMATVSQEDIKSWLIPYVGLEEQKRVAAKIEETFTLSYQAESEAEIARVRAYEIDQAILIKALRGELAAQNPNDEPASELLLRIKEKKKTQVSSLKKIQRSSSLNLVPKKNRDFKSIQSILEETGEISIEQAFNFSGFPLPVFWDKLKVEIDSGIIERIDKGQSIFLRLKK